MRALVAQSASGVGAGSSRVGSRGVGSTCTVGADSGFAGAPETLGFTAPAAGRYVLGVDAAQGGGAFSLSVQ